MPNHDELIDVLCSQAGPVKRVASPWVRALYLIPLMLVLGVAATTLLHQAARGWSMPANGWAASNAGLSLSLGTAGLIYAFTISVPGRTVRGWSAMMAALAVWIAIAATSIARSTAGSGLAERQFCFAFLLVAGFPMIAPVILALRRTPSLRPMRTLVAAGFGVAFLAFGLLAFCHPAEMSIADFVTHLMAALVLGLVAVTAGRNLVTA